MADVSMSVNLHLELRGPGGRPLGPAPAELPAHRPRVRPAVVRPAPRPQAPRQAVIRPAALNRGHTPGFLLTLDGEPLPDAVKTAILRIDTDTSTGSAGVIRVRLANPQNRWSEDKLFRIGREMALSLGYDGRFEPQLKGIVLAVEASFSTASGTAFEVVAYTHFQKLNRFRRTRSWMGRSLAAIARELAQENGLEVGQIKGDELKRSQPFVCQRNETAAAFLLRRARLLGYEVSANQGALDLVQPDLDAAPVVQLEYGKDLLVFAPWLRTSSQVEEVAALGWDPLSKRPVRRASRAGRDEWSRMGGKSTGGEIARGHGWSQERIVARPGFNGEELAALARGRFNALALDFLQARATIRGNPHIHPGTVVQVKGVGGAFSGRYWVTQVHHRLQKGGGFVTELVGCRVAADRDAPGPLRPPRPRRPPGGPRLAFLPLRATPFDDLLNRSEPEEEKPSLRLNGVKTECDASDWVAYHHATFFVELIIEGDITKVHAELEPKKQPLPMLTGVWEQVAPGDLRIGRMVAGGVGDGHAPSPRCRYAPNEHGRWQDLWRQGASRGSVDITLRAEHKRYIFAVYARYAGTFTLTVSGTGPHANLKDSVRLVFHGAHPHPGD